MSKSMLINTNFQTWFLIDRQHSQKKIRIHIRKPILTHMYFNANLSVTHLPVVWMNNWTVISMGLLPDTYTCRLRMCRECQERYPRHWLQRKPLFIDPGMHHGTWVTHVPWCMSGSITAVAGKRSRHSRRMRNPQFFVSDKRPIYRLGQKFVDIFLRRLFYHLILYRNL